MWLRAGRVDDSASRSGFKELSSAFPERPLPEVSHPLNGTGTKNTSLCATAVPSRPHLSMPSPKENLFETRHAMERRAQFSFRLRDFEQAALPTGPINAFRGPNAGHNFCYASCMKQSRKPLTAAPHRPPFRFRLPEFAREIYLSEVLSDSGPLIMPAGVFTCRICGHRESYPGLCCDQPMDWPVSTPWRIRPGTRPLL